MDSKHNILMSISIEFEEKTVFAEKGFNFDRVPCVGERIQVDDNLDPCGTVLTVEDVIWNYEWSKVCVYCSDIDISDTNEFNKRIKMFRSRGWDVAKG